MVYTRANKLRTTRRSDMPRTQSSVHVCTAARSRQQHLEEATKHIEMAARAYRWAEKNVESKRFKALYRHMHTALKNIAWAHDHQVAAEKSSYEMH